MLDVVGDRASCAVLASGLVVLRPELWPAVAVFLVQFMVVDCLASLSFLHWPLLSYNYFFCVDRQVWLLNWSPVAKLVNTVSVVIAIGLGTPVLALLIASGQLVLKLWTGQRIWQLMAVAEPAGGCGLPGTGSCHRRLPCCSACLVRPRPRSAG